MKKPIEKTCKFDREWFKCKTVPGKDGYCPRHSFMVAEMGEEAALAVENSVEEEENNDFDEVEI